ncbi:MAG TPA: putative sulfate exporter family transporter [Tepidisphaeraceae bacterium]|jgi:uncharacterized integral membrane protein (TIGR00698 family)
MSTSAAPADLSRYAWADYLDCMEGLPEPMVLHSPAKARGGPSLGWGLLATAAVTAAAIWISELPFAPFTLKGNRHPVESVMTAIILGMIAANLLPLPKLLQPGLRFTTKKLLPLAIILLGARLDFLAVVRVGGEALWMSVATIVFGLSLFLLCIRLGWVSRNLGLLLGVGTSICGATAVVAAAPVIDADEKDVTFSVATVTICGLLAMFVMPAVAQVLHLSDRAFGVWAGLSIHAMPQVVAAGFAYSQPAGDTATIVKLARVCLLAPVLLVVGWQVARAGRTTPGRRVRLLNVFPLFVLGFLAMALLRTTSLLPDLTVRLSPTAALGAGAHDVSLAHLCETVSKFLIVGAMAAVGLETRFSALKKTGLRPLLLGVTASVVLAAAILVAIKAMRM